MKRRSFIGSLLAMIPAALMLPRIQKPAAKSPDLFIAPATYKGKIEAVAGEELQIGDPVFINMNGKIEKFNLSQGNMVFGYITSKASSIDNNIEITLRGIS